MNTLAKTNLPFKTVQTIRLILIITLGLFWFALVYVLVRQIFFSFTFWSVTLFWLTLLFIGRSAGRQVVENKIEEDILEQNKKDRNLPTTIPEEDQSQTWKTAVTLYNLSLPLVMTVPILVYATDVRYDVVCMLANLNSANITIPVC